MQYIIYMLLLSCVVKMQSCLTNVFQGKDHVFQVNLKMNLIMYKQT